MIVNIPTKIPKTFIFFILYFSFCIFLIGCAGIHTSLPPTIKGSPGVYHRVKKDETLWRISKAYGVELERLSNLNRLSDTSRIDIGQLIFIPDATETMDHLTLQMDFKDKGGDFIWPLKGKVSSFFGMKKDEVKNKGISIQARKGTSIVAARSGKVAFCSEGLKGYGKIIIIDHLDGFYTVYAQSAKNLVRLNQPVRQGQTIAYAGTSGRVDTPELYFEIRKRHEPQNPFFYLP